MSLKYFIPLMVLLLGVVFARTRLTFRNQIVKDYWLQMPWEKKPISKYCPERKPQAHMLWQDHERKWHEYGDGSGEIEQEGGWFYWDGKGGRGFAPKYFRLQGDL